MRARGVIALSKNHHWAMDQYLIAPGPQGSGLLRGSAENRGSSLECGEMLPSPGPPGSPLCFGRHVARRESCVMPQHSRSLLSLRRSPGRSGADPAREATRSDAAGNGLQPRPRRPRICLDWGTPVDHGQRRRAFLQTPPTLPLSLFTLTLTLTLTLAATRLPSQSSPCSTSFPASMRGLITVTPSIVAPNK